VVEVDDLTDEVEDVDDDVTIEERDDVELLDELVELVGLVELNEEELDVEEVDDLEVDVDDLDVVELALVDDVDEDVVV
jgi:hypothetical protein